MDETDTRRPRKTASFAALPAARARTAPAAGRESHLERSADEGRPAESLQPPDRELEPDEEEDERDAELGDRLDAARLPDPAERVRPDRDAGDEEADDLRELQPPADEEDGERRREDDREIPQERPLPHGGQYRNAPLRGPAGYSAFRTRRAAASCFFFSSSTAG